MQVVIPMSGAGARFARAGYSDPKPLIKVDGRPMIEHVIGMFPDVTDFIFVCSRVHLEETRLESVLRNAAPTARIVAIEPHKLGPVHATLQAGDLIQDSEPVVVNYCDFAVHWNFPRFRRIVADLGCEGALTAYRGFHPHTLGPNLYAYLRHRNDSLLEIREKHCFTSDRMQEYASSGTYYFRSGALLKHYYRKAIRMDLSTNGEYYASMPYNLMVQDGLRVHVHELEHFLQWGTPEDLEEYQGWSDFFACSTNWRPARRACGTTLIPMAGDGVRFVRENYSDPKPLVPVGGTPMIERALNTLPVSSRTVAICRGEHLNNTRLSSVLLSARPGIETISLDHRTEGQACTCLIAEPSVENREPVLVAPCDSSLIYDEDAFDTLTASRTDCVAFTFRDHPHANRNPHQYGWVSTGPGGIVTEVSCKIAPRGDVRAAQGITGMFWFREARMMFEAIRLLMDSGQRVNNEFYLDSALPFLIGSGLRVRTLDVDHYICFGTPDDVRTWEYWEACFRKSLRHPYGKEAGNERAERTSAETLHRASVL